MELDYFLNHSTNNRLKILFISQFFPPEMGAAASRIAGLSENLRRLGHDVTVLTGFPNYPSGVIGAEYRRKLFVSDGYEGVRVNRVWVFASPGRRFITRLLNYFSLVATSILFGMFDGKRYDVVVASSPPLFLGIAGYIISKTKGAGFVLDIRDIWPKIGVDTGELDKESSCIKLAEGLEDFLYKSADLVTVVTEGKAEYLHGKSIAGPKVKIVPNGVDREFLDVKTDQEIISRSFSGKSFTVLYAGLIGIAQGVDVMVKAAHILKERSDIRFYIVGDGVEKESIVELAQSLDLKTVAFVESQPKEKIATFLRGADVTVIPLKRASFADSVPSKLLESMAFGCPVILSASGESAAIVERSGGGVVTAPGDPAGVAAAILRLKDDDGLRRQCGVDGQQFVEKYFMRDNISRDFGESLENLPTTR